MDDLISRQAAIDTMCSACGYNCNKSDFVYNAPQDEQVILCPEHYALTVLPPTQPERKKGKWIYYARREPQYDKEGIKTYAVAYKCSECGFIHNVIENFGHYKFCPQCGADMKGE